MGIQTYMDDYVNWVKKETAIYRAGDYYEITIPFLNEENDYLQFYAKLKGGKLQLTDDGYTVRRLEKPGFGIPEDKKQILEQTTKRYHVMLQGNELTSYGSAKDFSSIIHSFIQCMIYVSCI